MNCLKEDLSTENTVQIAQWLNVFAGKVRQDKKRDTNKEEIYYSK